MALSSSPKAKPGPKGNSPKTGRFVAPLKKKNPAGWTTGRIVSPPKKKPSRPGFERGDVGRRIRVHWNTREAYDGIIDTFYVDNGRVHITYDDGDKEWLNPLDTGSSWEFLCPPKERNPQPGFEREDVGRRIRVHWNTREAYDGIIDTF
ncbi:hypothetical protein TrVE_jg3003, partial [Triparma verrucosa]